MLVLKTLSNRSSEISSKDMASYCSAAGVVDKHIDEAKHAHHLVDHPLAVLVLAQIGRRGDGSVGSLVQHEHSEGIVGLLVLAGLDIGEGDGGRPPRRSNSRRRADAIGAAGGRRHRRCRWQAPPSLGARWRPCSRRGWSVGRVPWCDLSLAGSPVFGWEGLVCGSH